MEVEAATVEPTAAATDIVKWQEEIVNKQLQGNVDVLLECFKIGCCPRCSLRFSNVKNREIYQQPDQVRALACTRRSYT
jgi:hypothetical protein